MAVVNLPLESQYGFKGPGFNVDEFGNITATSINATTASTSTNIFDFTVTEAAGQFAFANIQGNAPSITLARSNSYRFSLDVPNLGFNIYQLDQATLYSTGLAHSDGNTGANAQGKLSGILSFSVSAAAPDVLYYGNSDATIFGTINIVDPQGVFSTVDINSTTVSTSSLAGALTVAGGVGIEGDLYIGGSLNIDGVGIQNIGSSTNLELEAANNIVIKIDGASLGVVKSTGSTVPVVDTTINNTTIGATTPAAAAFTSATVTNAAVSNLDVTNKKYVDNIATALAVALGS